MPYWLRIGGALMMQEQDVIFLQFCKCFVIFLKRLAQFQMLLPSVQATLTRTVRQTPKDSWCIAFSTSTGEVERSWTLTVHLRILVKCCAILVCSLWDVRDCRQLAVVVSHSAWTTADHTVRDFPQRCWVGNSSVFLGNKRSWVWNTLSKKPWPFVAVHLLGGINRSHEWWWWRVRIFWVVDELFPTGCCQAPWVSTELLLFHLIPHLYLAGDGKMLGVN